MRQPKFKNINVTCPHDCPDTCSLVVTVDKSTGKAVKLKGNEKHPITKDFYATKSIITLILFIIRIGYCIRT